MSDEINLIYLINYFNIVNSVMEQKNDLYARNVRMANELILSGNILEENKKALMFAMGDYNFVKSSNFNNVVESDDYINKTIESNFTLNTQWNYGQLDLYNKILDTNSYSFSMPTSYGKSFLVNSAIDRLLEQGFRIIISVPSLALMNEYNINLSKWKPANMFEKDVKLFVLTQERADLFTFSQNDYVIFDEAYEAFDDKERSVLLSKLIEKACKANSVIKLISPNLVNPLDIIPRPYRGRFFAHTLNVSLTSRDIQGVDEWTELNERFKNEQWIIYCSKENMLENSKLLEIDNKVVNELIDGYLTRVYGEDFLLVKMLKKGYCLNNGDIPKDIRYISELLFKNKIINVIFANTTIVQGVNLNSLNLLIIDRGVPKNSFTKFLKRNLIGRVGRYSNEDVSLRHGHVFVKNRIKNASVDTFMELNDKQLLDYNKEEDDEISQIKLNDSTFVESGIEKDILDYWFTNKDELLLWVEKNKEDILDKNFYSLQNIELISDGLFLVYSLSRTKPKEGTHFKWTRETFIKFLSNIIKKTPPFKTVKDVLQFQINNLAEFQKYKTLTNYLKTEPEKTFKRLTNEISRRNYISDVLFLKLSTAISKQLKMQDFILDKEGSDRLNKLRVEGVSEVFSNTYEDLSELDKKELRSLENRS